MRSPRGTGITPVPFFVDDSSDRIPASFGCRPPWHDQWRAPPSRPAPGRDEQQDQDTQASGLGGSRSGVLQAQDQSPPPITLQAHRITTAHARAHNITENLIGSSRIHERRVEKCGDAGLIGGCTNAIRSGRPACPRAYSIGHWGFMATNTSRFGRRMAEL